MIDTGAVELQPLWNLVWWAVGVAVLLLIVAFFVKAVRRDYKLGLVKSPACVERLQGTILQELWRVATERPHQGYRVRGRTPAALLWGVAAQ
jgi:hypothetical protein